MNRMPAIHNIRIAHLVLRLAALAILAELAVQRSPAVRLHVLAVLCRAEVAAVALFIGGGQGFSAQALWDAPLPLPADHDAARAALVLLAVRFRAMAALLAVRCRAPSPDITRHALWFTPGPAWRAPCRNSPPACDSS